MYDFRGGVLLTLLGFSAVANSDAVMTPNEPSEVRSTGTTAPAPWIAQRLAIQLYSFRDEVEHNLAAAMQTIRRLGFERVELYPVSGVSAATMRAALDKAGLHAISAHVPLNSLKDNLPAVIADAKQLGISRVGVAWIKPSTSDPAAPLSQTEADAAVAVFKNACKPLREAGIRLYLHNHGYEGADTDGHTLLDRILGAVDPECLDLQIDVFWAASAGLNPAQLIRHYGARVWSVHLKDRRRGAVSQYAWTAGKRDSVPLGEGSLEMGKILEAARAEHVEGLIVEDESPDAVQQVAQSLQYLRQFR